MNSIWRQKSPRSANGSRVGWGRCRKTSVLLTRYAASDRQWSKSSYMTALEKEVTKGWPPRLWRLYGGGFETTFQNSEISVGEKSLVVDQTYPVPRLSRVQWRIMYLTWRFTLIKYGGQAERKLFSTLTAFWLLSRSWSLLADSSFHSSYTFFMKCKKKLTSRLSF